MRGSSLIWHAKHSLLSFTLALDRCALTDEGLASLKNCKSLRFLSLEGIPLTGSFLKELKDVPLEYLNLASSLCDGTALGGVERGETLKMLSLHLYRRVWPQTGTTPAI